MDHEKIYKDLESMKSSIKEGELIENQIARLRVYQVEALVKIAQHLEDLCQGLGAFSAELQETIIRLIP